MIAIDQRAFDAMEGALLARWKREIAAGLARRFPQAAALGRERVEAGVRDAMAGARGWGGETLADLRDVAVALFVLGEVRRDEAALADVIAMLVAEQRWAAKMALLRAAVPELGAG